MHNGPETLKQFMIIDRGDLAGEDRATDRVLHATNGALDLWGYSRRAGPSRHRCVEHLVEVGLLTRGGSICQR